MPSTTDRLLTLATSDEQLVEHHVCLIRFARLQLRNDDWAEDAVLETILAALSRPQSFGNRSQLKIWLVGILEHKVIDLIRSKARMVSDPDSEVSGEGNALDRLSFKADGHFVESPNVWSDPAKTLQQVQFFRVMDACPERLPPALSSQEVCKELSPTPINLYVQLYRARLRPRECMNINWHGKPGT